MKDSYTVEEHHEKDYKRVKYTYDNSFELWIQTGTFFYSNQIPGTNLYDEVELSIQYEGQLLRIDRNSPDSEHPNREAVFPFCPIEWVRWFHAVLELAAENGDNYNDTRESLLVVCDRLDIDKRKKR